MTERNLRAGPLTVRLVDGELRHARAAGREVLRRIAVVVRDDGWGTVDPELERVRVEESGGGFVVQLSARCRRRPVDVAWDVALRGMRDGSLDCSVRVTAGAEFAYNRIGFVVLLAPGEVAGRPFSGDHGAVCGRLPELVGPQLERAGLPQPLFPAVGALDLDLGGGLRVAFSFEGDRFEMEDQRNWGDGSFKIYSTPLELGFPHRMERGEVTEQRVRVSFAGLDRVRPAPAPAADELRLGPVVGTMPAIGVALAPGDEAVTGGRLAALSALGPSHLRVDLAEPERWAAALAGAARTAAAVSAGVELALDLTGDGAERLGALAELAAAADAPVTRVLALGDDPDPGIAAALRGGFRSAAVCWGTNAHFADVNRQRPDLAAFDGVVFPLTPQAHAFDDDTLREALQAHADVVQTARSLFGERAVHVSPVTLRPRHGPGSEPRDGVPAGTDPRQPTPFAAAWTVGCLAALAAGGAAGATFFEATGARGIADGDGRPWPVHAVLAVASRLEGARVRSVAIPDPLALAALAVERPEGVAWLIANLTDAPRRVLVPGHEGPITLAPFEHVTSEP